jgi:acyl transferase domain-containing protein/acyl carrier protein
MDEAGEAGLEIAVIGMAGRFPGAKDIDEFWNNLKNGIESISFFSDEELKEVGIDTGSLRDQNYVKAQGMLADIEYFDANFFGYTPTEAEIMDPQICIFHECAWTALEDAGYEPAAYDGLIGLYAGAAPNLDWQARALLSGKSEEIGYFAAGHVTEKDYLSLRVSYKLSLKGPSFSLNTACSTSLVAIHLAYRAILTGECDMALAGGITLGPLRKIGYWYREGMINSPDGHCRAFDARAKGTIIGNGVGVVVLKRLEDAVWDRDHIYAVIKGAAINNDGIRKAGFTAPSVEGQAEVIKMALQMAEVEPETISYIEAHGTGTQLGDPVEIEALKLAFNTVKKSFCPIGSVKTNMGHLDAAAGAAGFIKTVLALNHKLIPPSLYFENPNPDIDFENSPFYVNTQLKQWENNGYPLRAGVSSFGIGGTNAHVILEEFSEGTGGLAPLPDAHPSREYQLILLSAKTQPALDSMTENLAEFLKKNKEANIADAAYTLQVGRKVLPYRRVLTCCHRNDAIETLSSMSPAKVKTFKAKEGEKPVIFMFSGLGSQYVDMGLDLYRNEPLFREEMDRCLEILNPILGYKLKEVLYPDGVNSQVSSEDSHHSSFIIHHFEVAQLVIFIIDYALAKLIMKWGIKPQAMIGYSFGEYAAACISGVFSLEDALKLIVYRGQLIRQTQAGGMLSVPLPREELEPLLDNQLSIAIDNGPSCVAAGSKEILASFEKQMKEKKVLCMWVQNSHALHSKLMEPIVKEYEKAVSRVRLNKPQIAYISNVTGDWIRVEESTDPAYWAIHLKETVRFATGIEALAKTPGAVFVEIGPGRDLSALVLRYIENKPDLKTIHLVRHPNQKVSDEYFLVSRIGRLWLWGVKIDWKEFHARENRKRISLPTYPFQRDKYWLESFPPDRETRMMKDTFAAGRKTGIAGWFYIPSWKRSSVTTGDLRRMSAETRRCWLLFMDNRGLGVQLLEKLKNETQDVITVRPGMEFRRETDFEFTINPQPGHHSDYEALFARLGGMNRVPDKIVHLWGVTAANHGNKELEVEVVEAAQDLGFSSLLSIAQVLGRKDPGKKIEITVVTNNMQEVNGDDGLCPGKATVLGPVKSISNEYANIECRSIDVILSKKGSSPAKEPVRQLFDELTGECVEPVVAYRDFHRWVQTFEPTRLEKSMEKNPRLRQEGVYLVTGGLGGMGLLLAGHLAKTVRAKLVLTGRSAFPPREEWQRFTGEDKKDDGVRDKIGRLKAMEKTGAEVLLLQADVTDEKQVRRVIRKTLEKFGRINGVIHAAGLPDGELIQRKKPGTARNILAAKVRGTLLLDKVLKDISLDFFVLCSSMTSIRAGIGQTSYCAANNFLDAFAKYKFYNEGVFTVSINWDRWQKVGIAAIAENMHKKLTGKELAGGISPEQGVEIFMRIINETLPQVAVSTLDPMMEIEQPGILDASSLIKSIEDKDLFSPVHQRPELETEYIAPGSDTEQKIAAVWAKFFGFEQIGVVDDFFELGGDSLKAMAVALKIHKELNIELPLQEFFNRPTIRGLVEYIDRHDEKSAYVSIETAEEKEYYPLASAQKRLYILQQMDMNNKSYNQSNFALLEGELDKNRFEKTFRQLIQRHESLRTSFVMIKGAPVQVIHDEIEFEIEYYDLAESEENYKIQNTNYKQIPNHKLQITNKKETGDHLSSVVRHLSSGFIRPFDLSCVPLLRVGLIEMEPRKHLLMADMHHIIADGISLEILKGDFMSLYGAEELSVLHLQYRDFSEWQNRDKEKEEARRREAFWLEEFEGEIPVLNLPADYQRPELQDFKGKVTAFEINIEQLKAIQALARAGEATLYMVLLSIFNILLAKLDGREDIVLGTPTAGRRHPELQPVIGMFANTLALRNYPRGEMRYREFLARVRKRTLQALENQDYPFEDLVEKAAVRRDPSRNPIFDVMFVMQNMERKGMEIQGLKLKPYNFEYSAVKFDLTLTGVEFETGLLLTLEYRTSLFKEATIEKFIRYFKIILEKVLENSEIKLKEIEIIPAEEKKQLIYDFNQTDAHYPRDKTVHQLFENQAEKKPDQIAMVGKKEEVPFGQDFNAFGGDVSLTYKELNQKSHQLACWLQEKGAVPDTIVAIVVERSIEMIVGILGILKAGGAYLPIDPEYPEERIQYMLKDSGAGILLKDNDFTPEAFNNRPGGASFHLHLPPAPATCTRHLFGLHHLHLGLNRETKRCNDRALFPG